MRVRTARMREARRWVRRNRPPVRSKLPALVVRHVLLPMQDRMDERDLTDCPYYRGVGTCSHGCWQEPSCRTDEPLRGWPRERMARGIFW